MCRGCLCKNIQGEPTTEEFLSWQGSHQHAIKQLRFVERDLLEHIKAMEGTSEINIVNGKIVDNSNLAKLKAHHKRMVAFRKAYGKLDGKFKPTG